jgi:Pyridoxamine 5'-phosphate oxidase
MPLHALCREPRRDRPSSPPESYGVPRQGGVFVDWQHVVGRLRGAEAYWLATVTPTGRPHVVPIWGVVVSDDLFLETGAPETIKRRNLEENRRVVVHLDDVNDVIIVRGEAVDVRPAVALGQELAVAFTAKYPDYHPGPESWRDGGLVQIEPSVILAWHDMPTATRWRFAPL